MDFFRPITDKSLLLIADTNKKLHNFTFLDFKKKLLSCSLHIRRERKAFLHKDDLIFPYL